MTTGPGGGGAADRLGRADPGVHAERDDRADPGDRDPRRHALATPRGIIGLRVPGAIGYRHLAIRLVSTACKMALDAASEGDGPSRPSDSPLTAREADVDFEAEVVSAFGEAFNNVAVHGFRGLTPGPVQIEVDWDDERLAITIVDDGRSFDPGAVAAPDLDALPEHGMGLFIMRSCMDHIDYRPGPPNVLRLVKLRGQPRLGLVPPPPESGARTEGQVRPHASILGGPPPIVEEGGDGSGRGSGVDLVERTSRGPEAGQPPEAPLGVDRMVESSRRR